MAAAGTRPAEARRLPRGSDPATRRAGDRSDVTVRQLCHPTTQAGGGRGVPLDVIQLRHHSSESHHWPRRPGQTAHGGERPRGSGPGPARPSARPTSAAKRPGRTGRGELERLRGAASIQPDRPTRCSARRAAGRPTGSGRVGSGRASGPGRGVAELSPAPTSRAREAKPPCRIAAAAATTTTIAVSGAASPARARGGLVAGV